MGFGGMGMFHVDAPIAADMLGFLWSQRSKRGAPSSGDPVLGRFRADASGLYCREQCLVIGRALIGICDGEIGDRHIKRAVVPQVS